ncbi:MAG: spore germination protein, partial [Lachnospiraceae bacterium]|nr:spore germination protein [Lachnospiraceae bacterium]
EMRMSSVGSEMGIRARSNVELNYAVKFMRILTLLLTYAFGLFGFMAGLLITFICLLRCKTFCGRGYLYPLIPFHWKTLKRQLFRTKI